MITLTDVFTFDKPVIVVKRGNHTYYLTDTPQSAIKADYPVPAIPTQVIWYVPPIGEHDPFAGITIRENGWLRVSFDQDGTVERFDYPSLSEQQDLL